MEILPKRKRLRNIRLVHYADRRPDSHVHMIIGSQGRELEKIVGEMKSFTSRSLRKILENHGTESRKEWSQKLSGRDDAEGRFKKWE